MRFLRTSSRSIRTIEDGDTGLKVVLFKDDVAKEVIVAFAGTDGLNAKDWFANSAHYGWNQWSQECLVMLAAIREGCRRRE